MNEPTGLLARLGSTRIRSRASALIDAPLEAVWEVMSEPLRWDDRVLSVRSIDGAEIREGSKYEVRVKILPWGVTSKAVEELVLSQPPIKRTIRGQQLWGTCFFITASLEDRSPSTLCTYESETILYGPMRPLAPFAAWIGKSALDDVVLRLQGYFSRRSAGAS